MNGDADSSVRPWIADESVDPDTAFPGREAYSIEDFPATDTLGAPYSERSLLSNVTPDRDLYPDSWGNFRCFMVTMDGQKLPSAPWGDRNNPDVECTKTDHGHDEPIPCDRPDCSHDARNKWASPANWVRLADALEWREKDPRVTGIAFIGETDHNPRTGTPDPYVYVDGDNVYDAELGVHPVFAEIVDRLGLTYTDLSTSETGFHLVFAGRLPPGVKKVMADLDDDPWGANSEPPAIEIEDANVCVATGKHVPGTPTDARRVDPDTLLDVIAEYDPDSLRRADYVLPSEDPSLDAPERRTSPSDRVARGTLGSNTPIARADATSRPQGGSGSRSVPEGYTPTATSADETATDIRDVFVALDQLDPSDLPLQTQQVSVDSSGWLKYDPSTYRNSRGGDSLHRPPDSSVFYDQKTGASFRLLNLFAFEQGILDTPFASLTGSDWWTAVDAARDAGADIPQYDDDWNGPGGYTTILPEIQKADHLRAGWDYHGRTQPAISKADVHDRVEAHSREVMAQGDYALINALMSTGKTHSALKALTQTGRKGLYLAGTKRLREEAAGTARRLGLDVLELPDTTLCPCFNGAYGEALAEDLTRRRDVQGLTPAELHDRLDLPCDHDHEAGCPYRQQWTWVEEHRDEYDVLIGDYGHGHLPHLHVDREVIVDEDPSDRYTTQLYGEQLERAVNAFCAHHFDFPCADYTDVLQACDDPDRRGNARDWFSEQPPEATPSACIDSPGYHVLAAHAVYTLLFAESVDPNLPDNRFKRTTLPDDDVPLGLFVQGRDRDPSGVELRTPPDFSLANSLQALDGTPNHASWQNVLGLPLTHREPLASEQEKHDYIRHTLGIEGIDLSNGATRPHSGGSVNVAYTSAALHALETEYGIQPVVFDTKKAIQQYRDAGLHADDGGPATALDNFANVRGTNDYATDRLAYIAGSPHFGDGWVRKQAAWLGGAVYRQDNAKGTDLTYTAPDGDPVGDQFLWQMREANIAQAALRVGRNGQGAVVAFGTSAIPDWFPVAGRGGIHRTWTDHQRDILTALADLAPHASDGDGITTHDILDHPSVTCGLRWVEKTITDFRRLGYVSETDHSGPGFAYLGDGLHRVNDHGEVELPTVAVPNDSGSAKATATGGVVGEGGVGERTRNNYYTASFVQSTSSTASSPPSRGDRSFTVDFQEVAELTQGEATDNPPPD
jgi:hypothetical protein